MTAKPRFSMARKISEKNEEFSSQWRLSNMRFGRGKFFLVYP